MSNFEPYVDPFAAYVETPDAGRAASKVSNYDSWRLVRLQRWSTAFKLLTVVFTLAAIFSTFFANETSSQLELKAEYKYFTSFKFVLYTNAVVCFYAVVISVAAFLRSSTCLKVLSEPTSITMTVGLVLNALSCVFLLMAFAAGTATEIISRNGWHFSFDNNGDLVSSWTLCGYFKAFCVEIEVGLGFTGLAFLSLAASTCIDGYYRSQLT